MIVFRWIIGVIAVLLAIGSVGSFVIFILADIGLWLERARKLRRLTSAVLLFWFNVEVWGRVLSVLIHWR